MKKVCASLICVLTLLPVSHAGAAGPIVFSRVDASQNFPDAELYKIDLDGSGLKRITKNDTRDASPSWSPDGKRLAFECRGAVGDQGHQTRGEICVMRADGSHRERLTNSGLDAGFHEPSWSPNGKWIAFVRERRCGACSEGTTFVSDLMLIKADGTRLRALTHDAELDAHPTWAPGSRRLASIRSSGDTYGIAIIDIEDGIPTFATQAAFMQDREPAWSPDGKRIAFIRLQEHHSSLMVINPDGTDPRVVVKSGAPGWPAWSPFGKRLVFTRDDDLFRVNRDGTGLRRITGSSTTNRFLEFDAAWR